TEAREVRPDLQLDEGNQVGLDGPEEPGDGDGEVEWISDDVKIRAVDRHGAGKAGVGGGGDDDFVIGGKAIDEGADRTDFADADGVDEHPWPVWIGLGQADRASESGAPVRADLPGPDHADQPPWSGDQRGG